MTDEDEQGSDTVQDQELIDWEGWAWFLPLDPDPSSRPFRSPVIRVKARNESEAYARTEDALDILLLEGWFNDAPVNLMNWYVRRWVDPGLIHG